jgi:hypothetical protein
MAAIAFGFRGQTAYLVALFGPWRLVHSHRGHGPALRVVISTTAGGVGERRGGLEPLGNFAQQAQQEIT